MVLDSSAIIAILFREDGFERYEEAIEQAEVVLVGGPTVFETGMVLSGRYGRDGRLLLRDFLTRVDAEVVPFSMDHAEAAIGAFLRFGRGNHSARLNFGDCMSYAIAAESGLPLLYKGDDFSRTDVRRP